MCEVKKIFFFIEVQEKGEWKFFLNFSLSKIFSWLNSFWKKSVLWISENFFPNKFFCWFLVQVTLSLFFLTVFKKSLCVWLSFNFFFLLFFSFFKVFYSCSALSPGKQTFQILKVWKHRKFRLLELANLGDDWLLLFANLITNIYSDFTRQKS